MNDLRLNLGCGAKYLDGYINVDKYGDPDLRFDLETFPYPWDDDSVATIELHHVLEHLGQLTDVYLKIIQELYRTCKPGATINIEVPHHRNDNFFHDPTHVRPITVYGLSMFSKKRNQEWIEQGDPTTPLGLYLDVDFELIETVFIPSPVWLERYADRASDTELLLKESEVYSNLIRNVKMVLKVIK
jgi:hypothetical protein